MAKHKVTFLPGKQSSDFEAGISLLDAALELGVVISSSCAGIGTCAKCRVIAKEGVSQPTPVEADSLSAGEIAQGTRLSCQARLEGDCLCIIPPESRAFGDQIMVEGVQGNFPLEPELQKKSLEVRPHQVGEKYHHFEALLTALVQSGTELLTTDLSAARQLPYALKQGAQRVTAVLESGRLLTVEPGDTSERLYGVAFDIGTTTVVARLVDIRSGQVLAVASELNPQCERGADVVTRLKHIMEDGSGLKTLHRLIIRAMNGLLKEVSQKAGVSLSHLYKCTVVGNTVMQHIVLAIDPRDLASSPYTPAFRGPATVKAAELGLKINADGIVYLLPNLAGYVGSDITSVLTTLDLEGSPALQLVVDLGTNGEMVLGSSQGVYCASSPAGPAWEGAAISCGMRASRGAIERVKVVNGDLEYRVIGNTDPLGICGSGLADMVAELLRGGVITKAGRILPPDSLPDSIPAALRRRVVRIDGGPPQVRVAPLAEGRWLTLTQADVREVQLAKAAIASGIRIMMKDLGISPRDIATVHIAGAFGNHLRGQDALDLGLLPEVAPEKIRFIGNAAATGAEAVLLSSQARRKAERLAQVVRYVEIGFRDDFQEAFVDSMHFAAGSN
jgi:uncharacterized 2Fe-2S/4Fe-4S cluster protein (DUF4445 family)